MKSVPMKSVSWIGACAGLLLGAAVLTAQAQEHGHHAHAEHLDGRFAHNHYYPARGYYVRELPGRPMAIERGGGRYFYSGGVWYAPRGPRFVVVGAPIGVFVPVLPPFYTTVWFGGVPYYYANDTYYVWHDAQSGYEVVDPPGTEQAASTEAPPSDEQYVYPQKDQSADQQASDKYECHKWASTQSGFDPTQGGGGVAPDQLTGKRADYQRAMRACLEGRGYNVR
jgi:hypothetical protein